jgi:hypothetical protein
MTFCGSGIIQKSLALVSATVSLFYNILFFYITCLLSVQLYAYMNPPYARRIQRPTTTKDLTKEKLITIERTEVGERSTEQAATVTFMDDQPGATEAPPEFLDPLRDQVYDSCTELQHFLSRPIKLDTEVWNVGSELRFVFIDPWGQFIRDPRVAQKVAHYKLMNFDMHIKIVVNGTPFHYGRAICYYTPLAMYDNINDYAFTGPNTDQLTLNTQKPHVFINPTTCEGGEMVLPFFYPRANVDITSLDITDGLGLLQIDSINTLKHANGATDPVTVTVYGWAENVKLGVATQQTYDSLIIPPPISTSEVEERADEYGMGPISKPASALASIASKFKTAPVLGPYATATQIGANALSRVASIFGYSRTPILTTSVYRPNTKGSFATSNQEDDVAKLSLDCKQELSIDPRIFGRNGEDELDILSIASRQSFLDTFSWQVGKAEEELLWNAYVHPMVHRIGLAETSGHKPHYFTATSFASLPFGYWRGSLTYRFQVVSSKYHRGRLRFVWDPVGLDTTAPDYNTLQQVIVDITETTDFVIRIGWGADTTFLEMDNPFQPSNAQFFGTGPLLAKTSTHNNDRLPDMNGILRVYVVNELAVPRTDVNNDIEINVYVSAGDDFELAVPTSEQLSQLLLMSPQRARNTDPNSLLTLRRSEVQERADDSNSNEMASTLEQPIKTSPDTTLGQLHDLDDKNPLIHFGEVFRSFRSLLKRYNEHQTIGLRSDQQQTSYNIISRPSFPYMPSFTIKVDDPPNEFAVPVKGPNDPGWDDTYMAFALPTLMSYLGTAFVGWRGSTRWYLGINVPTTIDNSFVVSRDSFNTVYDAFLTTTPNVTTEFEGDQYLYDVAALTPGHDGVTVQLPQINNSVTFDLPFYSRFRFAPSRWLQNFSAGDSNYPNYGIWKDDPCFWMPSWVFKTTYNPAGSNLAPALTTMVSAGDDFNFVFYIGPPPLYQELTAPGPTANDSPLARLKRMKTIGSVAEI